MLGLDGELVGWLGTLSLGAAIRSNEWVIPTLQSIHIACIALVFSAALMLNLRLLGVFARTSPVAAVADRCVPQIWYLTLGLLVSGSMLIIGEPRRALHSPAFAIKMILLAVAVALTWFLHRRVRDDAKRPDRSAAAPMEYRVLGAISTVVWVGIIFAGRWIAYWHSR